MAVQNLKSYSWCFNRKMQTLTVFDLHNIRVHIPQHLPLTTREIYESISARETRQHNT